MAADALPPTSAGNVDNSTVRQSCRCHMWPLYVGEALWITFEVAWLLLLPVTAITSSSAAFLLIGASALSECWSAGWRRLEAWFPDVLQSQWLLVNALWMASEVCWDTPDHQTPWKATPWLKSDAELYEKLNTYCVYGFLGGPAAWLLAMLVLRVSHRTNTSTTPAWTLFYRSGYVSCWAFMDGVWAWGYLWASLTSCLLTIPMICLSASVETGLGLRGVDRTDVAMILWTLSNFFWILMELQYDDDLTLRYIGAAFGAAAMLVIVFSFHQLQARDSLRKRNDCVSQLHMGRCPLSA